MVLRLILTSPEETRELGRRIGRRLKSGHTVALMGELGAGKTCLTQGIAQGLDVPEDEFVVSPTFTLANEYQGRLPIYHLDVYRLSDEEFSLTGLEEYFNRPGVTVVEWAEKIEPFLPSVVLAVTLNILEGDSREAVLESYGGGEYEGMIEELKDNGIPWSFTPTH